MVEWMVVGWWGGGEGGGEGGGRWEVGVGRCEVGGN